MSNNQKKIFPKKYLSDRHPASLPHDDIVALAGGPRASLLLSDLIAQTINDPVEFENPPVFVPYEDLRLTWELDKSEVDTALAKLIERSLVIIDENGQTYLNTKPLLDRKVLMDEADFHSDVANRQGYVYFMRDDDSGLIKIGFSQTPLKRLHGVRQDNKLGAKNIELLFYVQGTQYNECSLHSKFSHLNEKGEWFEPAPELLSYIESLRSQQEVSSNV